MFKRPWFTFFVGLILGAGLVGFCWIANEVARGFKSWGAAQVYFDHEAREHISERLQPSPEAKDVYFSIEGFQDYLIFVAYTDSSGHLEKVVRDLTGKSVSELEAWKDQINHHTLAKADGTMAVLPNHRREPGAFDKKLLTSLYDVDVIRKGRFFEKNETTHGWHIIVDEETGRFYYHSWDT